MTITQVWDALISYIYNLYPQAQIRKQYAPIDDLENVTDTDRPIVWVYLAGVSIASVNTQANYVEDSYTFRIILAWKLRSAYGDSGECDVNTGFLQWFLTQFRHKKLRVGNSVLCFGLPNCDSPYDEDFIISPGVYLSTVTVPVSTYRDLDESPIRALIQDENQHEQSADEAPDGEG